MSPTRTARSIVLGPAIALLLAGTTSASQGDAANRCALSTADRTWLEEALRGWERVSRQSLRRTPEPYPWLVLFDRACAWHINPDRSVFERLFGTSAEAFRAGRLSTGASALDVRGVGHQGKIRAPDGQELPAVLTSFTATFGEPPRPFVVMAMPAIWRNDPRHQQTARLDTLLRGVLAHELTHALQSPYTGPALDRLAAQLEDPDDLDDDIIQTRFEKRAGFREQYERERDLLFRGAAAPDAQTRRALAAAAAEAMAARRAEHFGDRAELYGNLEDLFLIMEGAANWAAYRSARLEGLDEPSAIAFIRGRAQRWSQDEGLALFLLLEAQKTGWREQVLSATSPPSVLDLLRDAAR
jgi:hypothetical protein